MQKSAFIVANRTAGEWLSSFPTLILLLLSIFLASGDIIHSQLLKIGETSWQGYVALGSAGMINEPTCSRDPNIDAEVALAVERQTAAMADDPLAGIFGTEVDENAIRRSLESSRDICREIGRAHV